ncbi:L-lactate dehydrogenase [cytochrome] [Pseudooceanicola marinus]|uniref:L-lactate dehydrogenase [cytochrome] n=1 Tax=Pseudooceanicola marinus TaxID=396013 RepID=A0A1X6ZKR9_9RHOB|nr:alpha-hydroxy acid oxidase [Pseudooceanicola marinus]PJE31616.1 alpha-hydroxy-acid oxidizing protein [Pseudooceanicola marinus]SLN54707.1 L-lactate dehydrogenase [cytochrome] [Pseudooceanicola marinus]
MTDLSRRFVTTDDFARAARRKLPKIFADYIDGGSFSETTLRRNREGFDRYLLRQRVLHPLGPADLTTPLGTGTAALPFGPGPVGFMGLYHRDGDICVHRAATRADTPCVISTFSINGLATMKQAAGTVPDFQLYLDRDPEVNASYLDQCRATGVKRIFLTVDTAITSVRERDVRNGFRSVSRITPSLFLQFAARPAWSLSLLRGGFPEVELVAGRPEFGRGALAQAGNLSGRLDIDLTWDKVRQLRADWDGELIIKGISDPEDAARAAAEGMDGIVLSNHGGRQLDHGPATITRLKAVRAALGPDPMLFIDGGFRRGSDIVKAIALGADFVMMGRPFAWAVAAAGEPGVDHLIRLLATETAITLQLMGLTSIAELKAAGPEILLTE